MLKSRLAILAVGLVGCAGFCLAQPSLSTADVLKWREAHPEQASPILPPVENKSTANRRTGQEAAEQAWNDQLRGARERARTFERKARQAEIRATETRNLVFFSDGNSLNSRNEAAATLNAEARDLGSRAAAARAEVSALISEGQRRGYVEQKLESRLPSGEANPEYYRQRYLELSQELSDAEIELRSDTLRSNRYSTAVNNSYAGAGRITSGTAVPFYPNRGAGDLFFANRLYARFSESFSEREKTGDRVEVLRQEIEILREEGRKAGLPPGLFR